MALEAVSSLARILEQMLQHQHVLLEDRQLVESLVKEVNSFQVILECSSQKNSEEINSLRSQITTSAYNENNFIESHTKKQLPSDSESRDDKKEISIKFSFQFLEKVRTGIYSIKKLVMAIEEESQRQELQPRSRSSIAGLSEDDHPYGEISAVGLDDDFNEIKIRLVRGSHDLKIVSVVGMGGIGKTTLARKIYNDSFVMSHFDVQIWTIVSQSYNLQHTLTSLLHSMENLSEHMQEQRDVQVIKEYLYKGLKGKRYLIVMDDVWGSKVWDDLRQIFPNDRVASRILLTTRLENVAVYANSSPPIHHMRLLGEDKSWNLLRHKVFGEDSPPHELEEIGKKMSQKCQGLPLAIVVLAGLLSKAARTQDYWRSIAENLSSVLTLDGQNCSKILSLSYIHLPHHLKYCFLYTGVFPEDFNIRVSTLLKIWVSEGAIKPTEFESLEDAAFKCLLDLIDRNLIMVGESSSMGKIKSCKIHDLVRDFCTREAKNNMLFHTTDRSLHGIPVGATIGCLSIHPNSTNIFPCDEKKLPSLTVSSIFNFDSDFLGPMGLLYPRPLREFSLVSIDFIGFDGEQSIPQFLYNFRYIACGYDLKQLPAKQSSVLSYLQTFIHRGTYSSKTPLIEILIWKMPKLRHIQVDRLSVSNRPEWENSDVVLKDLQTLSQIENFTCSKDFIKRIPNLKKLGISYAFDGEMQDYSLNNLVGLEKLEALRLSFPLRHRLHKYNLSFPPSLRKLTLKECTFDWVDMSTIGCLPNLEVFKILYSYLEGPEWEPVEGEFLKLKYLLLQTQNLVCWKADSIHFPSLRWLVIDHCKELTEIPSAIGDIITLQLIELRSCTESLEACVKKMQEDQRELGNDDLQVHMKNSNFWWLERQIVQVLETRQKE